MTERPRSVEWEFATLIAAIGIRLLVLYVLLCLDFFLWTGDVPWFH